MKGHPMKTRTVFYLVSLALVAGAVSILLDHADAMRADVLARSSYIMEGGR